MLQRFRAVDWPDLFPQFTVPCGLEWCGPEHSGKWVVYTYGSEGWGFEYLRARYITAGQRPPKRRDSTGPAVETSSVDTEAHVGEPLTLKLIPGFVRRQFAAMGF